MTSQTASISIFQQSAEESNIQTTPQVPSEVFEAAKTVVKTQQDQIIRHHTGIYIIQYSENGPFRSHIPGWLPVHITKVLKWTSGGIKDEEFQQYLNQII